MTRFENDMKLANEEFHKHEAWLEALDDKVPLFTKRDIQRAVEAAVESTSEGFNGEWGYSLAAERAAVDAFLRHHK